jgi:threonine dehydrogenase-like Zn-dependent dehydrogenase
MAVMQALTYAGKEAIELAEVARSKIVLPTDVIVRVTLCGICGR